MSIYFRCFRVLSNTVYSCSNRAIFISCSRQHDIMKKATKIIFLAILLAMTSTVFSLPRLSLADREFDFGRIEPLSKQIMEIELSNDGDSRLEIYRVRACCGATASISTNSIPPKGSATLTVTLGPMAKPGPFRKKVTLEDFPVEFLPWIAIYEVGYI